MQSLHKAKTELSTVDDTQIHNKVPQKSPCFLLNPCLPFGKTCAEGTFASEALQGSMQSRIARVQRAVFPMS